MATVKLLDSAGIVVASIPFSDGIWEAVEFARTISRGGACAYLHPASSTGLLVFKNGFTI